MSKANSPSWLISAAVLTFGFTATPTSAQISPDATLPNNSVVLPNGNVLTIEGGTIAGTNLFHSFEAFSIPTGGEAFFNNALTIDSIITRVTGGNLSDIDGTLRANGTANLFLINPNGIQFGPNASLNIGGSFLGSTADSLLFEDGSFYSAIETNVPPLLTVSVPVGLQMGTNPGAISLQGAIVEDEGIATVGDIDPLGLQVSPRRTIALVGGPLAISGSNLIAEEGRLELGSVGSESLLELSPAGEGWGVNYDGATDFGNIEIDGGSTLRVSGAGGGSIALAGRNITIADESNLLAQTLSLRDGGLISLRATEDITLIDSTLDMRTFGVGNATSLELEARSIFLDGTSLNGDTQNQGNASSIVAAATDTIFLNNGSAAGASTVGSGQGGFIDFSADTIVAENGSRFITVSVRNANTPNPDLPIGDAGKINLTANSLTFERSGVILVATAEGNAGEVNINVDSLHEVNGFAEAFTRGSGNGGVINVTANSITMLENSGMASRTEGTGDGGRITIDAGSIFVEESGFTTDTRGMGNIGNGGEIDIRADSIVLGHDGNIRSESRSSGDAGTIRLEVGELQIDGGIIQLDSRQTGNAGSLDIIADSVRLDNEGSIVATTIAGDGGNIAIETNNLQLFDGSDITTSAAGAATGGNMRLNTDLLVALDNSEITANAVLGTGGNIDITTQGIFLSPDSSITASSQFGVDGIVAINNPVVDPASGLVALDSDTLNPDTQVSDSCTAAVENPFVFTGSGGLPEDPTDFFRGRTVWRDTRLGEIQSDLTPNSTEIAPETSTAPTAPLVEATGWRTNDRGQVELVVASGNPTHSSWQPHPECDSATQATRHPALPEQK